MTKKIKDFPLKDRPREKLLAKGSENLHAEELLAILLGSGTKKRNVISLARLILKEVPFCRDSLPSLDQLRAIDGVGYTKACVIIALYELVTRWSSPQLSTKVVTPDDAICQAHTIRAKHQEHLMVLYLNARSQLLEKHVVAIGRLNHLQIDARDIFAPAFLRPCSAIIVIHNHPSNDCEPSPDDLDFTQQVEKASKLLGLTLLDHIIVSKDYYYSLREQGKLEIRD